MISELVRNLGKPANITGRMRSKVDEDTKIENPIKVQGRRNCPLRKIFQVNQNVNRFKRI